MTTKGTTEGVKVSLGADLAARAGTMAIFLDRPLEEVVAILVEKGLESVIGALRGSLGGSAHEERPGWIVARSERKPLNRTPPKREPVEDDGEEDEPEEDDEEERAPSGNEHLRKQEREAREKEARILAYVAKARRATQHDFVAKLAIAPFSVRRAVAKLVEDGKLVEAGFEPKPKGMAGGRERKLYELAK